MSLLLYKQKLLLQIQLVKLHQSKIFQYGNLPTIKVPWTEWLIYSVIVKWGTKLVAATSSNQFRLSVPLIAPIDNYDPTAFKDMDKGDDQIAFVADDLSDMDSLLEEIMGDDFLDDF